MTERTRELIERLAAQHRLSGAEYAELIEGRDADAAALLAERAVAARRAVYGDAVFTRGLIEISSFCKNDCLYCGLRRSNANAQR